MFLISKLRPCNFELVGCFDARLALLASDLPSDTKIFLKMMGFPAFSKTLA